MAETFIIRGGDLKVYVNNKPFGKAVSFQWTVDRGIYAIPGIDEMEPLELADGHISIRGSMSVLRLRYDGGLEGAGLTALPHQQTLEKYISIHVVDRRSDTVVFQSDKVRVANQQWSVGAKGRLEGSFSFECIGYVNDSYGR